MKKCVSICIIFLFVGLTTITSGEQQRENVSQSLPRSNTLYVGGSGSSNYTRIQDAIENASEGDTVFVYDDSSPYFENVIIDKSIQLIGEETSTTCIDAQENGTVIEIHADNVTVTHFCIQHSGRGSNAGINLYGDTCILSNNLITDNFFGIRIHYSNGNVIQGNELLNNNNDQIYLYCTNRSTIQNNMISRIDYFTAGIFCYCGNGDIIRNNTINKTYYGIYVSATTNSTIETNQVTDCFWKAVILSDAPDNIIRGNILREPTLLSQACDVTLMHSPRCLIENNSLLSGILLEDSFPNRIQDNLVQEKPLIYLENESDISLAAPCGQIILFHCRNITVLNQDIQQTVRAIHLDGSENCHLLNNTLSNNRQGIICINTPFTTLSKNIIESNYDDGLAVDASNNNIFNNTIRDTLGIGLQVNGANNMIAHNIISNNRYVGLILSGKNVSIIDNTFSGNKEGIRIRFLLNSTMTRNSLIKNSEYGISMTESSKDTIVENMFTENGYGLILGIQCYGQTIRTNEFRDNQNGVLLESASHNDIMKNNFINNGQDAYFRSFSNDGFYNKWFRNYWDQPKLIKIIWGTKTIGYGWTYDIFRVDWFPALKPYDISEHIGSHPFE